MSLKKCGFQFPGFHYQQPTEGLALAGLLLPKEVAFGRQEAKGGLCLFQPRRPGQYPAPHVLLTHPSLSPMG